MKHEVRYDIGTLRPPKRLPNGMLRVDGLLTRAGVFEYLNHDGSIRREYRPPEEVFRDDSLQSFALCPFTDGHPPVPVTAANAREYAVGSTSENIRRDGDHVAGAISVFDGKTIKKMEAGNIQLSCGYEVDIDETPGMTPDGQRYDAIQRNIRGNHVALVARARAGDTARVRMDEAIMVNPEQEIKKMGDKEMKEAREAMEQALVRASSAQTRADAAEANLAEMKRRAEAAEGELDSVRTRLKNLEKLREDEQPEAKQAIINGLQNQLQAITKQRNDEAVAFPVKLKEAVKARVALEGAASTVLSGERLDDLDDRHIMVKVVGKLHGVAIDDSRSDDYVRARFDAAIEGFRSGQTAIDALRVAVHEERKDMAPKLSPREEMIKRNREAWKVPAEAAK